MQTLLLVSMSIGAGIQGAFLDTWQILSRTEWMSGEDSCAEYFC